MFKKILITIGFIIVVGVFYLFTQSQNIMEISREIEIDAPKDKVWMTIADINGWSDWNSAINASSGELALGNALSITMRGEGEGQDGPTYAPTVN